MKNKLLFVLFILFVFGNTAIAQYGIKLSQYRPTEETGFVYSKGLMVELNYRDLFEDHSRGYYSVGFVSLKPRQEAITNLNSYYGGTGGYVIQQVKLIYSNQNIYTLDGGMHYTPFDYNSIIKPYIGLGIAMGYYSFTVDEYYESGAQKNSTDYSFVTGGVKPQIGLEINPNDRISFFAEGIAAYLIDSEKQYLRNYQIGLGVTINLE